MRPCQNNEVLLTPLPELPGVSYVMPVLNEEGYLESAVRTILAQVYAGEKQIVLALGPSNDRTCLLYTSRCV